MSPKARFIDENGYPSPAPIFAVVATVVFLAICLFTMFHTVPAGHCAIVVRFGAVRNTLSSGLRITAPLIDDVVRMDLRVRKIVAQGTSVASKDLQDIKMDVAVNYRLEPEHAATIYRTVGVKHDDILIAPAIQESVKAVTATYSAEQLITMRVEVSRAMEARLSEKLAKYGIVIDSLNIVNFDFSPEFTAAIEQKQAAQQLAEKAKRDLERIKTEAEQKIVQAKAEAEALRIQRMDITPDLLKLREIEANMKAIEKWDGHLPSVTGGSVPFVGVK